MKKNESPQIVPKLVFKTRFLDDEETAAKKKDRINKLYLLSQEAQRKDELEKYYDLHQVFDSENLIERILSKDVLDKIRVAIKRDTKFTVSNKDLANNILKFINEDKKPNDKTIKKILTRLK
ncbi:MAG: hypothetical protein Q4F54_05635 [Coriobacteriia bacterium]|nr:hypothetical protein [Coriobacteriia bacterium]